MACQQGTFGKRDRRPHGRRHVAAGCLRAAVGDCGGRAKRPPRHDAADVRDHARGLRNPQRRHHAGASVSLRDPCAHRRRRRQPAPGKRLRAPLDPFWFRLRPCPAVGVVLLRIRQYRIRRADLVVRLRRRGALASGRKRAQRRGGLCAPRAARRPSENGAWPSHALHMVGNARIAALADILPLSGRFRARTGLARLLLRLRRSSLARTRL